jgi:hypothetical protein
MTQEHKVILVERPNMTSAVSLSVAGRVLALAAFDPSIRFSGSLMPVLNVDRADEIRTLHSPARVYKALAVSPDCRTLAAFEQNGEIHRWELASGKERRSFTGHRGAGRVATFSSDATWLASGGDDSSIVLWDLRDRLNRSKTTPADTELAAAWSAIRSDDPLRAERAVNELVAGNERSVALIRSKMAVVTIADGQLVALLVAQLSNAQFERRADACTRLAALGESAVPGLRQALLDPLSLDSRRRIERLIERLAAETKSPGGERLRAIRALEVIEQIHSSQARAFVFALSNGMEESWLTQEAKAVLGRWALRAPGRN